MLDGRALIAAALLAAAAGAGCAGRQVGTDVPLTRVVLYRNGVGYFERTGTLEGDSLRFRVRREHVGDFLATLAVIDSRGHARSVSFPSVEESEEGATLVEVEVALGGSETHDLTVAYVVETPIWRPSYRVVMGEGDEALLQGWAVVQNLSGEDWTDVQLSVTSGAPLSFRSDLGVPVIPPRPTVRDSGEIVAAPVYSETALAVREAEQEPADALEASGVAPPPPAPSIRDEAYYDDLDAAPPRRGARAGERRSKARGRAAPMGSGRMAATGSMAPPPMSAAERTRAPYGGVDELREEDATVTLDISSMMASVQSLAAGAVHEGVTRYDARERVTVRDSGSTMVAILNRTVPGEDALLYRPDSAVPGSTTYPMRVVRLRNTTGVLLERGAVAIYQTGALLGQGLLEPLPVDATTSIPFAVERTVAVTVTNRTEQTPARLVKIAGGRLTVEEFSQRSTTYQVRNGADRATKLYVRHQRTVNWELVDPPAGTEQVEGAMLVPLALQASRDAELVLVERTPVQRTVDLLSDLGAGAVALYLEGPAVDAAAGPVLREALQLRERLTDIQTRRAALDQERRELAQASSETRSNLEAIRRIARASDLRDRLTRRLAELASRIDSLTNQIVELDAEVSELRVRLSESIRELTLEVPEATRRSTR